MPPKKKIKRGKYTNYDQESVEKALEAVTNGRLGVRAAAEAYNVPKSTLSDKYRGNHIAKNGRPNVLSSMDENHLLHGILTAANWGYPLTSTDIRSIVKGYLDRKGLVEKRFRNNEPGPKWLKSFMIRHKHLLSARLSENIKRQRSAVSRPIIEEFFQNLEVSLQDVPPENIVNYDETNMTDDPGQEKVIVRRGAKHAERIIDSSKSSTSVMFAVSANGDRLPVYIVYKATNLHDTWTKNGPQGTLYNRSASGWFDGFIFTDWFDKVALPYFRRKQGRKILIGDNLASHISVDVVTKCEEYNIQFILLPANSTHLCQPLDVAYFRPLKRAWKSALLDWKKRHRGAIPKEYFPLLLKKTLESIVQTEETNIKSGFRACGIFPINRNEVLKRLPSVAEHQTAEDCPEWCLTFSEHLQNTRMADTMPKRQRRKKLNVPPGKAVTGVDVSNQPSCSRDNDPTQNATNKMADKDKISYEGHDHTQSENEAEIESEEIFHDSDTDSEEIPLVRLTVKKIKNYSLDQSRLKPNNFLVCKFLYNKNTKREVEKKFVAKILKVEDSGIQISCLRRKDSESFIFPIVEDITEASFTNICTVLQTPQEKRGKFRFCEDLTDVA